MCITGCLLLVVDAQEVVRTEEIPSEQVHIHGTITVTDAEGNSLSGLNGTMTLYNSVDEYVNIPVVDGTWDVHISAAQTIDFYRLDFESRSVVLDQFRFEAPIESPLELTGHWAQGKRLAVISAATGRPLSDLQLVRAGFEIDDHFHPEVSSQSPFEELDNLTSPVELRRFGTWFVRAPNHAWEKHYYYYEDEEDEVLELEPACELELDLTEISDEEGVWIGVGDGPWSELFAIEEPTEPKTLAVANLPPGDHTVRSFLDFHATPWLGHSVTLSSQEIQLSSQATTRAALAVGEVPEGLSESGTVHREGVIKLDNSSDGQNGVMVYHIMTKYGGSSWSVMPLMVDEEVTYRRHECKIENNSFEIDVPYGCALGIEQLSMNGIPIPVREDEKVFMFAPDEESFHVALFETLSNPIVIEEIEGKSPAELASSIPEGHIRVEGLVVIEDPDGVEHANANGSFRPFFMQDGSGLGADAVTVVDGRFTLDIPVDHSLNISDFTMDQRSVILKDLVFEVEAGVPLLIRGRWPPPTKLKVVDAESGIDLSGVSVVKEPTSSLFDDEMYPGSLPRSSYLADGVHSPFEVVTQFGSFGKYHVRVWVGAPGHAWQSVLLDFEHGGEHLVKLSTGADLEITVSGELPITKTHRQRSSHDQPSPQVRLRKLPADDPAPPIDEVLAQLDKMSESELPDGVSKEQMREQLKQYYRALEFSELILVDRAQTETPIRWQGVPPGEYQVSVEQGDHWPNPLLLGREMVTLRSGETASIHIAIDPVTSTEALVPLAGTFYLPPSWNLDDVVLHLEPMDKPGKSRADDIRLSLRDMRPILTTPGLYRWNAGQVTAGRWETRIYSLEYQGVIATGPTGNTDVQINIAPPADVTVHLIDQRTGAPASGVRLLWNCQRPLGLQGVSLGNAEWDELTGTYHFRAPAGAVELSIFEPKWSMEEQEAVTFQPGPNSLTIQVRRNAGIHLRLTESGRSVPLDSSWFWKLEAKCLSGYGTGRAGSASETQGTIVLTEGGRYEITFPELPGFQPIAPFEVEVPEFEFVDYELKVTRD